MNIISALSWKGNMAHGQIRTEKSDSSINASVIITPKLDDL